QKLTQHHQGAMSALPPKADIERHVWHVRFVPKADSRTPDENACASVVRAKNAIAVKSDFFTVVSSKSREEWFLAASPWGGEIFRLSENLRVRCVLYGNWARPVTRIAAPSHKDRPKTRS